MNPGDVLLIPPKWWHYVENVSVAVSINMWIPLVRNTEVHEIMRLFGNLGKEMQCCKTVFELNLFYEKISSSISIHIG